MSKIKKVLIVGGVAGGATVAARVRRLDEEVEITMFERGPHVSFSNCALPFYLSRKVPSSESLVMMTPEKFKNTHNIIARVNQEVIKIMPNEKRVLVKDLITGKEYSESYDKLVLSPGATPIMPKSIKGIDKKHVFSVKNVVDIVKIDNYIRENNVKNVAVIGGGFIGVEVMENLKETGVHVTLVEGSSHIMRFLDKDMAQIVQKEILDHGVDLIVNDPILSIEDDSVTLESGKKVTAGAVIMAIGVKPETKLAVDAGIELGVTGGIKVDKNYRTNFKDIYAVGDAIEVESLLLKKPTILTMAGPAQREARAVADHMYGIKVQNKGVLGSGSIQVFDLNIASTGLNARVCEENGIDYDFVYTIPFNRVGLIPGASPIHLKLIFEVKTKKVLGVQAISKADCIKHVDIVATLIKMGGTLEDLRELELCYSPTYSTARSALNLAALVALNVVNGDVRQVRISDVRKLVESGAFILDVREKHEYDAGHILGSVNIPTSVLRDRLDEIPRDKTIYLHCRSSQRSYNVARILSQRGYDVYNISGSFLGFSLNQYFEDVTTGRKKLVSEYNFK